MFLHLIRHGQTDWNAAQRIQGQQDIPLNEVGRAQARALGDTLQHLEFVAAYASTSQRARETAALILRRPQTIICRDDLREICLGEWEGQCWQDLAAQLPDMHRRYRSCEPDYRVPGAETRRELGARGVAALQAVVSEVADGASQGPVLVVSHGALIRQVLAAFLGIDLTEQGSRAPLPNCSHSIIAVVDGLFQVQTIDGRTPDEWLDSR